MLLFDCPHCRLSMETEVENEGRQFQCPTCHHLIAVPAVSGETQHGQTWTPFPVRARILDQPAGTSPSEPVQTRTAG